MYSDLGSWRLPGIFYINELTLIKSSKLIGVPMKNSYKNSNFKVGAGGSHPETRSGSPEAGRVSTTSTRGSSPRVLPRDRSVGRDGSSTTGVTVPLSHSSRSLGEDVEVGSSRPPYSFSLPALPLFH